LIQAIHKMPFAFNEKLLDYWNWKYDLNSIDNSLVAFFEVYRYIFATVNSDRR
jgi:hypothetical protein